MIIRLDVCIKGWRCMKMWAVFAPSSWNLLSLLWPYELRNEEWSLRFFLCFGLWSLSATSKRLNQEWMMIMIRIRCEIMVERYCSFRVSDRFVRWNKALELLPWWYVQYGVSQFLYKSFASFCSVCFAVWIKTKPLVMWKRPRQVFGEIKRTYNNFFFVESFVVRIGQTS